MSTLHKTSLGLALAGLALALSAPAAHAQTTVFTNFGPGNTFDTGTSGDEWDEGGGVSEGEGFTVSTSGSLSTITIALSNSPVVDSIVRGVPNPGGTNDAHLFLASGAGGRPGPILESFTLTNLPAFGTAYTPEIITSAGSPFLTAGTTYFLYEKETGSEENAWNLSFTDGPHIEGFDTNSYSYSVTTQTQGAFSVQVKTPAAVPEPSAPAAFACGVLGLAGLIAARRKKAEKSR